LRNLLPIYIEADHIILGFLTHFGLCILSEGNLIMAVTDRVEINPKVMMGKPVIRGTRITVELIFRKMSEGASEAGVLDSYPRLTREDIQAAFGTQLTL
jgi:uncharacterized protein (DUF433 family)